MLEFWPTKKKTYFFPNLTQQGLTMYACQGCGMVTAHPGSHSCPKRSMVVVGRSR